MVSWLATTERIFRPIAQWAKVVLTRLLWILSVGGGPFIATAGSHVVLLDRGWRFHRHDPPDLPCQLAYDHPVVMSQFGQELRARSQSPPIDSKGSDRPLVLLRPWILPSANPWIADLARHYVPPDRPVDCVIPCAALEYNDGNWEWVDLPHDWAIEGPFDMDGRNVSGEMGRLPSPGVGWYRKRFELPAVEAGRRVFLEVEGAMAYAAVWLNGHLVGGWPYGYATWRLDLTRWIRFGHENVLAIRLENPPESSRWYPGAGLYRNVRLILAQPVRVDHWGIFVTTPRVERSCADVQIRVTLANDTSVAEPVTVQVSLHVAGDEGQPVGPPVSRSVPVSAMIDSGTRTSVVLAAKLKNPRLWGPPPTQRPHRYVAVTTVMGPHGIRDRQYTVFGVRRVEWHPDWGLILNGEQVPIRGVNLHHDHGALGAAFHPAAARRQLEILRRLGCNAIRTAHNPPAPGLLELTDQMGFLVLNEIFDCWERRKTPHDFHRIFPDWHEADLRAFIRRDRNHPSVLLWSIGNEVGEQYTGDAGALVAERLYRIAKEEDPTRPITSALNWAKPDMPLPAVLDVIGLNYQGEGIRDTEPYAHLKGIRTPPQYQAFHERFPNKVILSTETAAAVSTRGAYLFPVTSHKSAPVQDGDGGNRELGYVSAYELYTAEFGSSPDKVFAALDSHPFVAGEFVWSGFDYLGEPTPYPRSRSSYFGIIDLAGFPKDRYYLYQSRWRPDLPMVHILPHWTWPERVGQVTPVHVFTTGDEVELFLNGRSLGRKRKEPGTYRLRWDDVVYEPGVLRAVAYRQGQAWASAKVRTAGEAARLDATADRKTIRADGRDLAFVEVRVTDASGTLVPRAFHRIRFTLDGPGQIAGTDNGDPTDLDPFPSPSRRAFHGRCLVIVRSQRGCSGLIRLTASADGLVPVALTIRSRSCVLP